MRTPPLGTKGGWREGPDPGVGGNPNQSVVSPLNLYRLPCVAACLAPESAIPKLVPGDTTGYAIPISRIHLIGYLVEDGITSSVHAKHTFSRTSITLRVDDLPEKVDFETTGAFVHQFVSRTGNSEE